MAESEHSVKINIEGNSTSAEGAFSRVRAAVTRTVNVLSSVRAAASRVMSAFGTFGLAVQGVTMLVNAFRWLKDRLTETARIVAKLKWDIEMRAAANETARLVGWHEKLAKLMKDELDTLTKQRAVAAIEREGKRDYENGRREAERARQIFEAKTPEAAQALRDRFAAEDEQRSRDDRKAERKRRIRELDDEESAYTSKAKGLRNNNADIDEQLETERHNLMRANGNEELAKPIRERIAALENRKTANDGEIANLEKEAKFRRDQIKTLEAQRDWDGPTAGYWNRKAEEKRREEESAQRKTAEAREKEDAARALDRARQLNALDVTASDYKRRKRRLERSFEREDIEIEERRAREDEARTSGESPDAAERESAATAATERRPPESAGGSRSVATALAAASPDAAERETRRERIKLEEREEDAEAERETRRKRLDELGGFADRLAAQDGVSRNRLTAMGLGSGVEGTSATVANDVRRLVKLLEDEVAATRAIDTKATYGD